MNQNIKIEEINDINLAQLLTAERAALILSTSTCGNCASYQQEIVQMLKQSKLPDLVLGKIFLDRPGSIRFKRDNPWLSQVRHLPYTVLYRRGRQVDVFPASKASYLAERVEDYLYE